MPALRRLALALELAAALAPLRLAALEPATVSATGSAELVDGNLEAAREQAFEQAALDAVVQVARGYLPEDRHAEAEPRLRNELAGRASGFVLTYRIDRQGRASAPERDPERLELALTATIDAGRLREELRRLDLLDRARGEGPSLALRVRTAEGDGAPAAAALETLARGLAGALQQSGLLVVDPLLRAPDDPGASGALELARALGADIALDVGVSFEPRSAESRASGGVARAQVRAQRARDGFELALASFEATGYHADADEAQLRALEALEPQIAQSLRTQLERNWTALERGEGTVVVSLADVSSLLQIESVRSSLKSVLGADSAELVALGPRRATLRVETALSPGTLQEKLAALFFEGFRLEPLESGQGRVDLRVEAVGEASGPASP